MQNHEENAEFHGTKDCKFEPWNKSPYFYAVDYRSDTPMSSVTVPTGDTASVSFWLKSLVEVDAPVMMMGPAGTGKTQMVIGLTNSLDPHERTATTVNFNFYTSSAVLQLNLELLGGGKWERKGGGAA